MWTPIMANDTRLSAVEASAYLPDPRAEHYWDLWRFTSKALTAQLKYPPEEFAWDMFVLYKPHLAVAGESTGADSVHAGQGSEDRIEVRS